MMPKGRQHVGGSDAVRQTVARRSEPAERNDRRPDISDADEWIEVR